MKFYIISIVLNVMALFIPVAYYVSNNNEKENKQNEPMTVNLSESVFTNVSDVPEGVAGNKNNGEENDKYFVFSQFKFLNKHHPIRHSP